MTGGWECPDLKGLIVEFLHAEAALEAVLSDNPLSIRSLFIKATLLI